MVLAGVAAVVYAHVIDPIEPALQRATIAGVTSLSAFVGLAAESFPGSYVEFERSFGYIVAPVCVGSLVGLLLTASVIAYPTTWRNRLIGLLVGLPLMYVINLVRLVNLGWLGVRSERAFDVAHTYGWGIFSVVLVASLWILWLRLVVHPSPHEQTRRSTIVRALRGPARFVVLMSMIAGVSAATGAGQAYMAVVEELAAGMASSVTGIPIRLQGLMTTGTGETSFAYAFTAAALAAMLAVSDVPRQRRVTATLVVLFALVFFQALSLAPDFVALAEFAVRRGRSPALVSDSPAGMFGVVTDALQAVSTLLVWMWLRRSQADRRYYGARSRVEPSTDRQVSLLSLQRTKKVAR